MGIGLKCTGFAGIVVLLVSQASCKSQQAVPALERKISMPIFWAERLESVMMRVALNTGRRFDVSLLTRSDVKAKEADYHDVAIGIVLDEQLKGTPFYFRLNKNELKIYKKEN